MAVTRAAKLLLGGMRVLLSLMIGKEAVVWDHVKTPKLRYRVFNDEIDCLIYAFSLSFEKVFFVQVGSNDSKTGDPLYPFLHSKRWRGVMIEPVDYVFNRLARRYGKCERFVLENVAIAKHSGTSTFYYLQRSEDDLPGWYDQVGTFHLPTILKHKNSIPDFERRLRSMEVPCLTFNELCSKHSIHHIDLVHIDVEGYDYEILKQIDFDCYVPVLIIYESKHLSVEDQERALQLLEGHGYRTLPVGADVCALHFPSVQSNNLLLHAWSMIGGDVASISRKSPASADICNIRTIK